MKKCGDCIHADICKQVNGGWFSCENIAYCRGFKDRSKYVEVVRCKDCKHFIQEEHGCNHFGYFSYTPWMDEVDFCSYGERRKG